VGQKAANFYLQLESRGNYGVDSFVLSRIRLNVLLERIQTAAGLEIMIIETQWVAEYTTALPA